MRALQRAPGDSRENRPRCFERGHCSMAQYIACDAHLKYSVFRIWTEGEGLGPFIRVEHADGELGRFLGTLEKGSPVALETTGFYGWLVEAVEAAGLEPHLAHAAEAKKLMGGTHKNDAHDADGLLRLLRNGTLPEVWVPPAAVRDLRGLVRGRLALRRYQSALKCRIHGILNHYGVKQWVLEEDQVECHDWLSTKNQAQLMKAIEALPSATREATRQQWLVIQTLEQHIHSLERSIEARKNCNHFLKWAFVEAANVVVAHKASYASKHPHVVELYERVKATTKLSGKAKVAVARHLAESAWWVLSRKQLYREPSSARVASSNNG